MKHAMFAAAAVLAVGAVGTAHAQRAPSSINEIRTAAPPAASAIADSTAAQVATSAASLNALLTEWDQAGFLPPGKPGQSQVYGRNGYATSGAGYNVLVSLIRSAGKDVREGRDHDAAAKIAIARGLLAAARTQE
ncbi:MAG TPA: hypothetical protein VKQ29_09935 [Aliidongia sp.]|nr:hypothetical protein [Aliidongia sp.]